MYDFHERARDILTPYNDTVRGRCAVCLENFSKTEDDDESSDEKFTERIDLTRMNHCYHKFHLICVHRDWFMQRFTEKDEYGGTINYEIPEVKRCPICRRDVENEEITYIKGLLQQHPEIDDGGYH